MLHRRAALRVPSNVTRPPLFAPRVASRRLAAQQLRGKVGSSSSSSSSGGITTTATIVDSGSGGSPAEGLSNPFAFELISTEPLAGGTLDIVRLEGHRMLRVWLPPGYSRAEAARHGYPLVLLNDGQNLFDDANSFSGVSWRAAQAAAAVIACGAAPPFAVAGVDHGGARRRSYEYLPAPPRAAPGGAALDPNEWPGGGVADYVDYVQNTIVPWLAREYGAGTSGGGDAAGGGIAAAPDPRRLAFGGSSFGAVCALWAAVRRPGAFAGGLLLESPALWADEEQFLREVANFEGPWPRRVYVAAGGAEYSGVRGYGGDSGTGDADGAAFWDEKLAGYAGCLAGRLAGRGGLGTNRLSWRIDPSATHTEAAWAARLPEALAFLAALWWADVAGREPHALFATSPPELTAGQAAVLLVNRSRSHVLAGGAPGPLLCRLGFNAWGLDAGELAMLPAPYASAGCVVDGGHGDGTGHGDGGAWYTLPLIVPEGAEDMHFALTDGAGVWDNNAGADFNVKVARPPAAAAAAASLSRREAAIAAAAAASLAPAAALAARAAEAGLYFTAPATLVAGAPMRLFFDRAKSSSLQHSPTGVRVRLGFNGWHLGPARDLPLAPAPQLVGCPGDWWATPRFDCPPGARDVVFAFSDGDGNGAVWDSNYGLNYSVSVSEPWEDDV